MTQLLQNAAYGTALILVVAALRRVLKDRLVPEARLALWAACLFRLLTPAAPESVLSLWGLFQPFQAQTQSSAAPAPAPVSPSQSYTPAFTTPVPAPQPDPSIPWEAVLCSVWLIVGAVLAVRCVLSWRRTRRAVACAIPLEGRDPRYALLPSCARLREGPMEGAPLTFGVVRPTVVLSPGLEGEELACVLAHEGVHAQRRDNLWHYVMALALVVHWWDPAVWLMARLLRWDIELACDRAALRKLGADRRAEYAKALVSLATQAEGPAFCQTFGRKAAEERILSIMRSKKISAIGVVLTLTLVLGVTVAFASEPKALDPAPAASGSPEHMTAAPNEEDTSSSAPANDVKLIFTENRLEQFAIGIDALEKDLSIQVSKGRFTQTEADQILAQARSLAKDGVLGWTFQADCGLTHESLGRNTTAVCYQDEDGSLVPVSLSEIVAQFILPLATGDAPTPTGGVFYKDGDGKLWPVSPDTVDTAVTIMVDDDGNITVDDGSGPVPVEMPQGPYIWTEGKDGAALPFLGGDYTLVDPETVDLSKIEGYLAKKVADGKLTQAEADEMLANVQAMIEQAKAGGVALWFSVDDGGDADSFCLTSYGASDDSSADVKLPSGSDLIPAQGTNGRSGYIRKADTHEGRYVSQYGPITDPEQAMQYMAWLEGQPESYTIPLYDSEGNVIGEFPCGGGSGAVGAPSSSATYPVCAVDGCTLEGHHTHDGVIYCGGEGHHGDTCDGDSCIYVRQNAVASGEYPSSTHHSEDHHSESHHSNGHHSDHH